MNLAGVDLLLSRMQRVGQAGALPKTLSQAQLIDELQRQISALADSVRALLTVQRAGPGFDKDSNLFLIDARTGSSTNNILSIAQATSEGFGAVAGLAVFRHGLGYRLDRGPIVEEAIVASVGVVAGQAARTGAIVLYASDEQRMVFQIDQDAVANQMLAVVSCYPSRVVPSNNVNPGTAQKTGVATPQLGLVIASTQLTELP